PNKKLTKMETVLEYLKEETDNNINSSLDSNQEGDRILGDDLLNLQNIENSNDEFKEEKTQVLWKDNNSTNECEKTQLLTYLEKSNYYYLTPIKVKVGTNEKLTKVKVSEYPFYIGKSTNLSNLVIEDKSISRRHGIITCMEDKILYTDLDSTNGTFINGNKLEGNKAYTLSPFDEISFANLKYLWEELEE
ncbi:MAG: hypothetical protein K0S61_3863, partial [Anaerocolumna sp.]|nr:hypothetical protein [Anaerocolumna sp.]